MKLIFITYSNGEVYDKCAFNLLYQAKNQFDEVKHFTNSDIEEYKLENHHIWNQYCLKTGDNKNGFWIWKPYIIKLSLDKYTYNDIVIYCDSKYNLEGNLFEKIKSFFIENKDENILAIYRHHFTFHEHLEVNYSKGDAFNLIGLNMNDSDLHAWAGFVCFRICEESIKFVDEWVNFCLDGRIITDSPSNFPNHKTFIQNRYDQTVFSLLLKKFGIKRYNDFEKMICEEKIINRI
jgi:hypothetical protein